MEFDKALPRHQSDQQTGCSNVKFLQALKPRVIVGPWTLVSFYLDGSYKRCKLEALFLSRR